HGSPSDVTSPRTGIGAPRCASVPPSVIVRLEGGRWSSGGLLVACWLVPEPFAPLVMLAPPEGPVALLAEPDEPLALLEPFGLSGSEVLALLPGAGGGLVGPAARRARSARSSPRVEPCGQLNGSGGGSYGMFDESGSWSVRPAPPRSIRRQR